MNVYVVTKGSYSDCSIQGVFSSHEKAVAYMGGFPEEFNAIEEYELDGDSPRIMGRCWTTQLRLNGSEYHPWEEVADVQEEFRQGERGKGWTQVQKYYPDSLPWFYGRSFVSKEHALKLAVEQRQKALHEHPEYFQREAASH